MFPSAPSNSRINISGVLLASEESRQKRNGQFRTHSGCHCYPRHFPPSAKGAAAVGISENEGSLCSTNPPANLAIRPGGGLDLVLALVTPFGPSPCCDRCGG